MQHKLYLPLIWSFKMYLRYKFQIQAKMFTIQYLFLPKQLFFFSVLFSQKYKNVSHSFVLLPSIILIQTIGKAKSKSLTFSNYRPETHFKYFIFASLYLSHLNILNTTFFLLTHNFLQKSVCLFAHTIPVLFLTKLEKEKKGSSFGGPRGKL